MAKNAAVFTAVCRDSWRSVAPRRGVLAGVAGGWGDPPKTICLEKRKEKKKELLPVGCALIRADTTVLCLTISVNNAQKKEKFLK